MTIPNPPTRLILLSVPRTTSNLFMRFFSQSPKVNQLDYPFMWGHMWGPDAVMDPPAAMPKKEVTKMHKQFKEHTMQSRLDVLQTFVRDAEAEGKIALIKEHTQYLIDWHPPTKTKAFPILVDHAIDGAVTINSNQNPTFLTTRFLSSLTPTFIIRHPARILPSFVRACRALSLGPQDPFFAIGVDYQFSRKVFDWYASNMEEGKKPMVIDADDLVADAPKVLGAWCDALGLDEAALIRYAWEKKGDPTNAFLGTVQGSEGVIKKDIQPVDLEEEYKSWSAEFGEENCAIMKSILEANMANYEYLKQYRI